MEKKTQVFGSDRELGSVLSLECDDSSVWLRLHDGTGHDLGFIAEAGSPGCADLFSALSQLVLEAGRAETHRRSRFLCAPDIEAITKDPELVQQYINRAENAEAMLRQLVGKWRRNALNENDMQRACDLGTRHSSPLR